MALPFHRPHVLGSTAARWEKGRPVRSIGKSVSSDSALGHVPGWKGALGDVLGRKDPLTCILYRKGALNYVLGYKGALD